MKKNSKIWWSNTFSNIVGTVVGIVLTFGVGLLVEYKNKEKDRKISTDIIVSDLLFRTNTLIGNFEYSYNSIPIIEEVVNMTPSRVESMPEDSLLYYLRAFSSANENFNELGRHLLNSNIDIIRSAKDYRFLDFLERAYNQLDNYQEWYMIEGPYHLQEEINKELYSLAKQQGIDNDSLRWDLMQMTTNSYIRFLINSYLNSAGDYLLFHIDQLNKTKEKIFEESGLSVEKLKEYEVDKAQWYF